MEEKWFKILSVVNMILFAGMLAGILLGCPKGMAVVFILLAFLVHGLQLWMAHLWKTRKDDEYTGLNREHIVLIKEYSKAVEKHDNLVKICQDFIKK